MKVKIVKRFNDKFTKERRNVNDVCEYSDARAKELISTGFAVKVTEADVKKTETPEKKG